VISFDKSSVRDSVVAGIDVSIPGTFSGCVLESTFVFVSFLDQLLLQIFIMMNLLPSTSMKAYPNSKATKSQTNPQLQQQRASLAGQTHWLSCCLMVFVKYPYSNQVRRQYS